MPATTYRDDTPGPGSTVWYATGAGWLDAEGGTLASARKAGDPDGRGTPSTAAEEQVRLSPLPSKKNNADFSVTISPADIPAYRMAPGPMYAAQAASEPSAATGVAAARPDRPTFRMHSLAERISWLELELGTLQQELDALQRGN